MSAPKTTPMIQQYLSIKEQYKDAILFYRMGDFYEMFFEDAHAASRALEITLTSRNKNEALSVPMCGVPYRAAQNYIARLIDKGFKVAICDQVEDPALAKGLVKREVVRVVTPGMIIENELLDANANNYLLAIALHQDTWGVSYLDISTGLFRVAETIHRNKISEEIQRVLPRELLLPEPLREEISSFAQQSAIAQGAVNWLEEGAFDIQRGRKRLIEQFQTRSLEGFGCQEMTAGLGAAGALLYYVQETQKQSIPHFRHMESYSLDDHLVIDHMSRLNLELEKNLRSASRQGTLISIIDRTITAMGGRQLKQWLRYPLLSAYRIGRRLDAVEEAINKVDERRAIAQTLTAVYDLERLNSKIVMGHANARDLLSLGRSLTILPPLWESLNAMQSELFCQRPPLGNLEELGALIERSIREDAPPGITEGGMIKKGFNPELDELLHIARDSKSYLAQLEAREREATGIHTLKVRYNKVFGYYIEVSKNQASQMPGRFIRKQTLVNAERFITDELKEFESKALSAEDMRCVLELRIFNEIRTQVCAASGLLQTVAAFLGRLDCLLSLATVADENNYCRPKINTQGTLRVEEGRHPVVEKLIQGERFVPNSIALDNVEQQLLIITGPNMAGKSTVLRQVALQVIMAQMGSFVPAAAADIPITDRVFTRVGALDNLSAGQSTFMVEMEETANILNHATADSLVIMDEIGRGTSTYDGLSIAWAVAEYLHDLKGRGTKTLFATHYHELTELARTKKRVKNYTIAVKEWNDQIIFLRKLVPGGTSRSYGIQVARLAGIPDHVVQLAKKILERIETHTPIGNSLAGFGECPPGAHKKPLQLDLFQPAENEILENLKSLDINALTPLEALNILKGLQDKIHKKN